MAFPTATTLVTVNFPYPLTIPAAVNRGVSIEPSIAWDRTGGKYSGYLYVAYSSTSDINDFEKMNMQLFTLKNNGATQLYNYTVNSDSTPISRFFAHVAVDQTSGKVGLSWCDCRGDSTYDKATQLYAAVSSDGGQSFTNINLEQGHSSSIYNIIQLYQWNYDYYDYTGSTYYGGCYYAAWADNSNTATNGYQMHASVAKIQY
jgi:hypothetical protein